MSDNDQARLPRRHIAKIFIALAGTVFGLLVITFTSYFVSYLWQSKYGSAEDIARLNRELGGERFTLAADYPGPRPPADLKPYVRPGNPITGNPDGQVTILAFVDFECPFSQEGYPLFKAILDTYGPTARVVLKHLPLSTIHPDAAPAAEAAACAGEQDKFWDYADRLFTSKKLAREDLTAAAAELELDLNRFNRCLVSGKYRGDIEQDMRDAAELGVRGTPTYFINQRVIEGVVDRSTWDKAILSGLQ
ncbi:MAG: DSBA oxidoreductase [Candidatus Magasanikbacteria bacterium GW2011_GWA2_56_11]|uniref:DSBA oxidoreductase n=1 Tax=Candidatus Magasanikbacteria bacterium GW2011_GWA2_56_11 TaxID=1619044 RepID=A0A0G1YGM3_9BACT|nr:MAG: DSBA oxidoreductase [Candidatus Magasanikbacteria bacterium GW2011_GWA2_56_11]